MSEQQTRQCKLCGMTATLDEYGYCKECREKITASPLGKNTYQPKPAVMNVQPIEKVPSKEKIVKKLYGYYKFFHTGSIIISIILFICWLFYLLLGSVSYHTQQYLTQNYANSFNPHWEVFAAAVLIFIFGPFLSYICAALCKWVENMEK